jgi:hypothetical protein
LRPGGSVGRLPVKAIYRNLRFPAFRPSVRSSKIPADDHQDNRRIRMRMTFPSLFPLFFAALLGACGSPSGGPGGMPAGGMGGPDERAGSSSCKAPADQIGEQLAETAQSLALTPKQTALWDAYQESIGALLADQFKLEPYRGRNRSALAQIGDKVDVVRNRLAAMEEVADRASILYEALDATQKKIADQRLIGTIPVLYAAPSCQGAEGGR